VASSGIWTILLRWAAEFRELARGIWQNFPRKTVGPTHHAPFFSWVLLQYKIITAGKWIKWQIKTVVFDLSNTVQKSHHLFSAL